MIAVIGLVLMLVASAVFAPLFFRFESTNKDAAAWFALGSVVLGAIGGFLFAVSMAVWLVGFLLEYAP